MGLEQIFSLEVMLTVVACVTAAAGTVVYLVPRPAAQNPSAAASPVHDTVFLFDGDELIDGSASAFDAAEIPELPTSWSSLRADLEQACPDFPETPAGLQDRERLFCATPAGPVEIERLGNVTRVALPAAALRPAHRPAGDTGLAVAPYPAWRVDMGGTVIWHNAAYKALVTRIRGRHVDLSRPIFPPVDRVGRKVRLSLDQPERVAGRKLWFDVTAVPQEDETLFFATDVNAVVEAEAAQRNFVQTLAKTFAQLSIGLAIFDRNRQLALFNPALVDLTALPADFLSARPTLFDFFDRLRDCRMMPEPRDYRSWRRQMAELDAAASDGKYQETWTLPSGAVYSISGRPHPDGAVAFMFENITAEVTLTRRFRADLEMGQAVLDQLDDAIAVFSAEGILAITNRGFRRLWDIDPDQTLRQTTIIDATKVWQEHSLPTPVWGELQDFVMQSDNRADWRAEIRMRDGRSVTCHVQPIQDGATMVRFGLSERSAARALQALPAPSTA
ncbi:PAS fold [Jhaorihella thermophila]|uniref:PAS fold n=1 Tax=Jhaorihella thermophila TaxID=488547 RepID=A0A1H5VT55_9RHOB|nr:PAS fold [Jhaorihella thermophila]